MEGVYGRSADVTKLAKICQTKGFNTKVMSTQKQILIAAQF